MTMLLARNAARSARPVGMMTAMLLMALSLALAGCGFRPMYGDAGGSAGAAFSWELVDVAPPTTRLQQLVYAELLRNRPPASRGHAPYELKITARQETADLLGSRLQRLRLKAGYALVQRSTGKVLLRGETFADESFEQTRLAFANDRGREAAQRTAAKLVAQDIRTRVMAFFARGMPVSAMPAQVAAQAVKPAP